MSNLSEKLKNLPNQQAKVSQKEIEDAYSSIEKAEAPKYGTGKKKQIVQVHTKTGKTFNRLQEVGVKTELKSTKQPSKESQDRMNRMQDAVNS